MFRPSSGNWYIQNSATGGGVVAVTGGAPGDVPVPAAYDGNGKTDIALFRPSTGTWYIQNSGGGTTVVVTWGRLDIPVE